MTELLLLGIFAFNIYLFLKAINKEQIFIYRFLLTVIVSNSLFIFVLDKYAGFAFLIRIIQFLAVAVFVYRTKPNTILPIRLLTIYLLALLVFRLNIANISGSIYFFTYFLIFLAGMQLRYEKSFDSTIKKFSAFIIVYVVFYLSYSIVQGVGKEMYSDTLTVGGLGVSRMNIITFSMIILFAYTYLGHKFENRVINIFLILTSIAILLLITKRTSIVFATVGIILIILQGKLTFQRFNVFASLLIFLILVLNVFEDVFVDRFVARGNELDIAFETVERTTRYQEYLVLPFYFQDSNTKTIMFGNGLGGTHDYRHRYLGSEGRSIHSGVVHKIYTIGVIGLLLIAYFYWHLFGKIYLLYRKNKTQIKNGGKIYIALGIPFFAIIILDHFASLVFGNFPGLIAYAVFGKIYGECLNNQS